MLRKKPQSSSTKEPSRDEKVPPNRLLCADGEATEVSVWLTDSSCDKLQTFLWNSNPEEKDADQPPRSSGWSMENPQKTNEIEHVLGGRHPYLSAASNLLLEFEP